MQLSFDLFSHAALDEAHARLLSRFGPQRSGGRHDPVSQLVKAIVSSRTYDAVSGAAYERLKLRYWAPCRHWETLMRAPEPEVRALIADVTYAETKAPCLIAALNIVHAHSGRLTLDFLAHLPSEAALSWLERIKGVGRKISAAVLNFSTLRGYAFVIDTHVLRVVQRLGWISPHTKTAEKAYAPFMALVPETWSADDLYEMHWLLKRLGQSLCRFNETDCARCPLRDLCAHAHSRELPADATVLLSEQDDEQDAPCASNDNAASLKAKIARLERTEAQTAWGAAPFGDVRIDARLPLGGLQLGHWHEIAGEATERELPAAAAGFAATLARRAAREGMIVWTLQRDDLYVPGLQAFGLDPDRLILVRVGKDADALSVQEDALRTRSVATAICEVAELDLTAGRRLQLICERSGATGFVLRRKLYGSRVQEGRAQSSAAATRWRIAPAPSEPTEPGLGAPRWKVELERCRGGRTGAWIMENEDATGPKTGDVRVVAELADYALEAGDGRALGAWRAWLRDSGASGRRASLGGGG